MSALDDAFDRARVIFQDVSSNISNIQTEEDAKIQIINRVIFDVLGWMPKDSSAERKGDNGYSDYIISDGQKSVFVLEAKRQGILKINTSADRLQHYKLNGPALTQVVAGIEQAASYAVPLGMQLSVVTDGLAWIVFAPFIPGENYKEKQAYVFPGSHSVLDSFAIFYQLLSKFECRQGTYKVLFDKIHDNRLVVQYPLTAAIADNDYSIEPKSQLAFDLDKLLKSFFYSLAGDDDPDLIINCFVETRESRVADFSLEKITTNVLGNIEAPGRDVDSGLTSLISETVQGDAGETVFIVGPTGAGKSTFLERFFKKTLPKNVRDNCVIINVNALDASGDERASIGWMTNKIVAEIEKQIFSDGNPNWNELLALYIGEYRRRAVGVDQKLYNRDKDAFKDKFSDYIDQQVEKDREGYLSRLMKDMVANRKKLPILVIDNTDEFPIEYKSQLFQYCQSIRRNAKHCLLIFPATDRSAWSFSKTDIFNIYGSKSFFLPTPSPREVFRKRVDYLKQKLSETASDGKSASYFLSRGVRLTISNMERFATIIENIFVDQDFTSKRLGEIANYNIRKTLNLARRVITSSIFNIEDIVKSYATGHPISTSPPRFMMGLLKGNFNYFRPNDDEHHIVSLFQVDTEIRQSPLLGFRILTHLRQRHIAASDDASRYSEVRSIARFFDTCGYTEASIDKCLSWLLLSELIETYDLSERTFSPTLRVAITHCGLAHLEMATSNYIYFQEMALTTRISNADVAAEISGAWRSNGSLTERLAEVRRIFATFLGNEDKLFGSIPSVPEFRDQSEIIADIMRSWAGVSFRSTEFDKPLLGIVSEGALATVDSFDVSKGFGFVSVPDIGERVFIHQKTIAASGVGSLYDGDDMLCDISRGEKGLYVSRIHSVEKAKVRAYWSNVSRLFPDRGYGFVDIPELANSAFFHYSLVSELNRHKLIQNVPMYVSVRADKIGASIQVREIIEIGEHK